MRYEEFPPPPNLRDHVRCAWIFEAPATKDTEPERIVPDGRCELVVHFGDAFEESTGHGAATLQPRLLFAGQLSRPLWLAPTGRAQVIGLRFQPAGARRFLGLPLVEATDRRLGLESLWPAESRALLQELGALHDNDRRIACLAHFVRARIDANPVGDDESVIHAAAWLARERGRVAIDALVESVGLGRRQFERRFRDAVGLSPRLFANVLRLRSVFDALQANPAAGWTDAALAAGYFDQSHLIRDFRRFVGCTPAQFVAATPGLATALVA